MVELLSHRTGSHMHDTLGELAEEVRARSREIDSIDERGQQLLESHVCETDQPATIHDTHGNGGQSRFLNDASDLRDRVRSSSADVDSAATRTEHAALKRCHEQLRVDERPLGPETFDHPEELPRDGPNRTSFPPGVRLWGGYLHFETSAAAEQYGEEFLGPIRDALPTDQLDAVRKFTEWSYPFRLLRDTDPTARVRQWINAQRVYEDLIPITGEKPVPTTALLRLLGSRDDISDLQRMHVFSILRSPSPQGKIDQIWLDSFICRRAENFLGEPPSVGAVTRLAEVIRNAVDVPIPDPVHAIRELRDIDFIVDINGIRIGSRPINEELLESLHGAAQTELGFMSTSLGPDRAQVDADESKHADKDLSKIDKEQREAKHVLAIDIPRGSHGLWIGSRSVYPEQRELLLAPKTRYVITGARPNDLGGLTLNAEVIHR
ncbi:ADP-ribosyltransferase [Nocardia sp. CDC160]|uniref:ADP-ribosyltransferase n=1 Tax=Nocardia sp. CDC160 TaxID=3112166 RepID=UPI002DB60151|nr:ADP-ribosyltransferase [Nocardia sp. CDC160]MEC3920268.1 ADP-ribosyltransferase [Nocardia sp. CDC160]